MFRMEQRKNSLPIEDQHPSAPAGAQVDGDTQINARQTEQPFELEACRAHNAPMIEIDEKSFRALERSRGLPRAPNAQLCTLDQNHNPNRPVNSSLVNTNLLPEEFIQQRRQFRLMEAQNRKVLARAHQREAAGYVMEYVKANNAGRTSHGQPHASNIARWIIESYKEHFSPVNNPGEPRALPNPPAPLNQVSGTQGRPERAAVPLHVSSLPVSSNAMPSRSRKRQRTEDAAQASDAREQTNRLTAVESELWNALEKAQPNKSGMKMALQLLVSHLYVVAGEELSCEGVRTLCAAAVHSASRRGETLEWEHFERVLLLRSDSSDEDKRSPV